MAKLKDLTGEKFGRWTVIKQVPRPKDRAAKGAYWECVCECGAIGIIQGINLRYGRSQSCGCLQKEVASEAAESLIGKRFGKLTVVEKVDANRVKWLCKCDCGGFTTARTDSLKCGDVKSCGCTKSFGEAKIQEILLKENIQF